MIYYWLKISLLEVFYLWLRTMVLIIFINLLPSCTMQIYKFLYSICYLFLLTMTLFCSLPLYGFWAMATFIDFCMYTVYILYILYIIHILHCFWMLLMQLAQVQENGNETELKKYFGLDSFWRHGKVYSNPRSANPMICSTALFILADTTPTFVCFQENSTFQCVSNWGDCLELC